MTALNLFVEKEASYLISDTAWIDRDGCMQHSVQKFVDCSWIGPLAIGLNGCVDGRLIVEGLRRRKISNVDDAIGCLGELLEEIQDQRRDGLDPAMGLVVAAVSELTGEPTGFVVSNDNDRIFGPVEPFVAHEIENFWRSSPNDEARFRELIATGGYRRGGIPLLGTELVRSLRKVSFDDAAPHPYRVGGHILLTKVSARGVEVFALGAWPDRLGVPIDPVLPLDQLAAPIAFQAMLC